VRVLGEEPGLGLPNQHTKACPRFQTMHCWCPPATGPNQPHEPGCSRYKRPEPEPEPEPLTVAETLCAASGFKPVKSPFFGLGLPYQAKLSAVQAQAYNHALQWLDKQNPASIKCNEGCTCAAKSGVIGHAAFCPLGEKANI
jgi:hypothetical protein